MSEHEDRAVVEARESNFSEVECAPGAITVASPTFGDVKVLRRKVALEIH